LAVFGGTLLEAVGDRSLVKMRGIYEQCVLRQKPVHDEFLNAPVAEGVAVSRCMRDNTATMFWKGDFVRRFLLACPSKKQLYRRDLSFACSS